MSKIKKFTIPLGQHVLDVGKNGSGKTWLARKYLAGYPHVIYLDPKRTLVWPEVDQRELAIVETLDDLIKAQKYPKIIYKPTWEEQDEHHYNTFYEICYKKRNLWVATDEVMRVCKNAVTYPDYLKAIMVTGRELGVTAWNCTQRPATIPSVVISEAQHIFAFKLQLQQDRQKLVDMTGCPEFMQIPGKHVSWYLDTTSEEMKPVMLKLQE